MLLRRLATPVLVASLALIPATAAFADGPAGSTANADFADASGDAPSAVDITNVHTYRTASEYRATVKYSALRRQKGNRWFIQFQSLTLLQLKAAKAAQARPSDILPPLPVPVSGNIVELRLTPGGQLKSLPFKVKDGTTSPATCTGTRAVPDWTKSKITFVIPNNCWRGDTNVPVAVVSAGARHYAPGTFENTEVPPTTNDAKSDSLDLSTFPLWFYGDDDGGLPL